MKNKMERIRINIMKYKLLLCNDMKKCRIIYIV